MPHTHDGTLADSRQIAEAARIATERGRLGIDTEFMSEGRYRPLLCLAEDVANLLELADELQQRLRSTGRLEWAREECRRLEAATDERDPYTAWERLPRINQLDPRSRAVAREVAAWRERTAASEDRPIGSVLADPPLVELAKRQPGAPGGLEQIRGIHPSGIRRRGPAIIEAIA